MKTTALVIEDSFISEEASIKNIKNSIGLFFIADTFTSMKSIMLWFANNKMKRALGDSIAKIDLVYSLINDLDDDQLAYIQPRLKSILEKSISLLNNFHQIDPIPVEVIDNHKELIEKLQMTLEMVDINLDNELINDINMALAEHE